MPIISVHFVMLVGLDEIVFVEMGAFDVSGHHV